MDVMTRTSPSPLHPRREPAPPSGRRDDAVRLTWLPSRQSGILVDIYAALVATPAGESSRPSLRVLEPGHIFRFLAGQEEPAT